jgi:hypothetical protein
VQSCTYSVIFPNAVAGDAVGVMYACMQLLLVLFKTPACVALWTFSPVLPRTCECRSRPRGSMAGVLERGPGSLSAVCIPSCFCPLGFWRSSQRHLVPALGFCDSGARSRDALSSSVLSLPWTTAVATMHVGSMPRRGQRRPEKEVWEAAPPDARPNATAVIMCQYGAPW